MVPSSLTIPIPILLAELSNPIAIILPAILCTFPAHTNLTPTLPLGAISYKTAKTNSAREQGERTKSERSSKCDGEIRVRSSIGTLLGESGRGFCILVAILFSKSDLTGPSPIHLLMTKHFGSGSFSILLHFE